MDPNPNIPAPNSQTNSQLPTANSKTDSRPRLWLTARTNLPGYTFIPEPVSDAVKETLGTTNIVSGTFYRLGDRKQMTEDRSQKPEPTSDHARASSSIKSSKFDVQRSAFGSSSPNVIANPDLSPLAPERITIFLATWSAESKKPLLMLGHTPDLCWTAAGWKQVDLGQPREVLIDLPTAETQKSDVRDQFEVQSSTLDVGRSVNSHPSTISQLPSPISQTSVPFSSRAFESPDRTKRELSVWCTLIDGEPLADSMPSGRESVQSSFPDAHVKMSILDRLLRATRLRLPVRGEKQFVRYSTPMTGDWQVTMKQAKSLVPFQLPSGFSGKAPI